MEPLYIPEDAVPPQEVRLEEVRVEPWADDPHRMRVHLQVTPFLARPNLQVSILNPEGESVSSVNIVEAMQHKMVFTMHIRTQEVGEQYSLSVEVSYPDIGTVDQRKIEFNPHVSEKKS